MTVSPRNLPLVGLLGADVDIVEIAALLHDYATIKDPAMYADRHMHGAREQGWTLAAVSPPV